jgi:hypothetical protein
MLVGIWTETINIQPGYGECCKEGCAWWDKTREHCIFLTIGYSLSAIMLDIMNMRKDMPHAGQFTK